MPAESVDLSRVIADLPEDLAQPPLRFPSSSPVDRELTRLLGPSSHRKDGDQCTCEQPVCLPLVDFQRNHSLYRRAGRHRPVDNVAKMDNQHLLSMAMEADIRIDLGYMHSLGHIHHRWNKAHSCRLYNKGYRRDTRHLRYIQLLFGHRHRGLSTSVPARIDCFQRRMWAPDLGTQSRRRHLHSRHSSNSPGRGKFHSYRRVHLDNLPQYHTRHSVPPHIVRSSHYMFGGLDMRHLRYRALHTFLGCRPVREYSRHRRCTPLRFLHRVHLDRTPAGLNNLHRPRTLLRRLRFERHTPHPPDNPLVGNS